MVDMARILQQHRKVFPIPVHIGGKEEIIKLKYLGAIKAQEIANRLAKDHPDFTELCQRVALLNDIKKYINECEGPEKFSPTQQKEFNELSRKLEPYADEFSLGCFQDPELHTIEEFDALGNAMPKAEWDMVLKMLTVLSAPLPADEVNTSMVLLCKAYNIPLATDLTAENMTIQQRDLMELGVQNVIANGTNK